MLCERFYEVWSFQIAQVHLHFFAQSFHKDWSSHSSLFSELSQGTEI